MQLLKCPLLHRAVYVDRLVCAIPAATLEAKTRVERRKTMSFRRIAPVVAFLTSDVSRGIDSKIFAVRRNEVFLMRQQCPIRPVQRAEGWSVRTLSEHMLPKFRASFHPLDWTVDAFLRDPV